MNEPMARKLEALLGASNRQLHLEETRGIQHMFLTELSRKA